MTKLLKAINTLSRFNEIQLIAKPNHLLPSLSMVLNKRNFSVVERQTTQSVNGLPKLPIPALNQTMDRLKVSVKPFAKSSEELSKLYQIIDEFSKSEGTGTKVHSLLEHKSQRTDNWLSQDWWVDKAYLEGRLPVMIWSNPGLVFPELQTPRNPNKDFVVHFISRLILSLIDFRDLLRNGVNPEMPANSAMKSQICMDQYNKIFGTCRIPGNPIDSIRYGELENNNVSIIISRFNKFYKLNLSQTKKEEMFPIIQSAVLYILAQKPSESIPFGSFTAMNRNDCSTVFSLLDQNSVNSIIESEFVVNIDHIQDFDNFDNKESYYNLMGRQSLHSDLDNIGNRWFDKTIQLIVVTNKSGDRLIGSAFCYEHTPAEGGAIVKMMEHSVKYLLSNTTKTIIEKPIEVDIEELSLLPKENKEKVMASAEFSLRKYTEFVNSLDLQVLEFNDYGKEFIKSVKYSPDSWIQLAIGLTFYRLHGKVGQTYESAGTRKFAFGRTETIRSVSNEFVDFYKNPNLHTLGTAIESHKNLVKNAVNGHGIDRILLGKCRQYFLLIFNSKFDFNKQVITVRLKRSKIIAGFGG